MSDENKCPGCGHDEHYGFCDAQIRIKWPWSRIGSCDCLNDSPLGLHSSKEGNDG